MFHILPCQILAFVCISLLTSGVPVGDFKNSYCLQIDLAYNLLLLDTAYRYTH